MDIVGNEQPKQPECEIKCTWPWLDKILYTLEKPKESLRINQYYLPGWWRLREQCNLDTKETLYIRAESKVHHKHYSYEHESFISKALYESLVADDSLSIQKNRTTFPLSVGKSRLIVDGGKSNLLRVDIDRFQWIDYNFHFAEIETKDPVYRTKVIIPLVNSSGDIHIIPNLSNKKIAFLVKNWYGPLLAEILSWYSTNNKYPIKQELVEILKQTDRKGYKSHYNI